MFIVVFERFLGPLNHDIFVFENYNTSSVYCLPSYIYVDTCICIPIPRQYVNVANIAREQT